MDETLRSPRAHSRVENSLNVHRLSLITSGDHFFEELVMAVDRAQNEVYVETYILDADHVGSRIVEALLRAARRGLVVRLLVDGVGSSTLQHSQLELWRSQGLTIHVFRPLNHWHSLKQMIFRRLHRKIAVIDRKIAFIGGMNLYEKQRDELDYVLKIEGVLAKRIHRYVLTFFFRASAQWIKYLRTVSTQNIALPFRRKYADLDFIVRDNIVHRNQIEDAYLQAIESAQREIILANAYFLPRRRFRVALRVAAKRGIVVKILLQGPTDVKLMQWATRSLYRSLLFDGVQIFEYERSILHAKVAVIDGSWMTVGSANLDIFSLLLNLEANVIARDPTLAAQLRNHLLAAIENDSREIRLSGLSLSPLDVVKSRLSLWILRLLRFVSGSRGEEE